MAHIPLIVGNWKMFKTIQETRDFCEKLLADPKVKETFPPGAEKKAVEVAVAPPFTALAAAASVLQGSPIAIAAQDVFWGESGAYTGEISPKMLRDVGCHFSLIGHSERRQYFHETDETVNKKAVALIKEGVIPIVCLGEMLAERQGGKTFTVIERQVRQGLKGLSVNDPHRLVIAYEPVWAIGTGQTATPGQAEEVHAFIRKLVQEIFSSPFAQSLRILYGGSVKPENIADLMAREDVDGALVGGASLDAQSFARIIRGSIS
ncbi:MAG: triose-phosphate isomerase [Deltaproteobacteria bacterium]|nr:triose-phosphate isomerase [Deltaproteobacteria bacterium]